MKIEDFNNNHFSRFSQSPYIPTHAATDHIFLTSVMVPPTQQSYKILNTWIKIWLKKKRKEKKKQRYFFLCQLCSCLHWIYGMKICKNSAKVIRTPGKENQISEKLW